MMIPVFKGYLEIGAISTWKNGNNIYFQAIIPQSNGQIISNTFSSQEEAEQFVKLTHNKNGYVPFHKRLESAIKNSNISQKTIGLEIGVSSAAVSKWVSGEQYPAVHFLYRLTRVLFSRSESKKKFLEWTITIDKER